MVDAPLAELLKAPGTITVDNATDAASRMTLPTAIVNTRPGFLHIRRRVQLAANLRLSSPIPAALIEPLPGDLVRLLLKRHLIADDSDAFAPRLMVSWSTREAAIVASKSFQGSSRRSACRPPRLPTCWRATRSAASIKQAVVNALPAYLLAVTRTQSRRIAATLVAEGFETSADALAGLVAGGAPANVVVPLLARSPAHLADAQLVQLFRGLGGEHSRAVDVGNSRVAYLPDDAAHREVLDRLVGAHVVRHHEPSDAKKHAGLRRVTLSRTA